jgi:hypothetical protein
MPAVQETIERVRNLDIDQYKYGFRHRYRIRQGPQGPVRGYRLLHLGEEERTRLDAGVAAQRLSPLAHHARAAMGTRRLRPDRLPGSLLLFCAEAQGDGVARRGRPRNHQDLLPEPR